MNFNQEKFKALVHYVCRTCIDPSKLSATKLHKILWLADVYAYKHCGTPVTGETYKKNLYGPFSTHLDTIVSQLQKENLLFVHEVNLDWGESKKRREFIGKGDVNKSLFSERELQIINDARDYVCENHTAVSISDKTHDAIWEMALMHEPIPYEAMLVSRLAKVTEEDIEWAKSELRKIKQ